MVRKARGNHRRQSKSKTRQHHRKPKLTTRPKQRTIRPHRKYGRRRKKDGARHTGNPSRSIQETGSRPARPLDGNVTPCLANVAHQPATTPTRATNPSSPRRLHPSTTSMVTRNPRTRPARRSRPKQRPAHPITRQPDTQTKHTTAKTNRARCVFGFLKMIRKEVRLCHISS